jgi:hypothetical protein
MLWSAGTVCDRPSKTVKSSKRVNTNSRSNVENWYEESRTCDAGPWHPDPLK